MSKEKCDEQGRIIYKPIPGKPSRFPKGVSGNLKGRKKGVGNKFSMLSFAKAIKSVSHDKKQDFMIAWLESAWGNASAMSEIMNYISPKLKSIEGLIINQDDNMTDEEAKAIRDKLLERFS